MIKRTLEVTAASAILLSVLSATHPAPTQGHISLNRAQEIVSAAFPDANITSIQRISQGGTFVWEALLDNNQVVYVDRLTGEIIGFIQAPSAVLSINSSSRESSSQPVQSSRTISFDRAIEIALAQSPGSSLAEIELKHGIWEAKLSNGLEVYINAQTGQVVKLEPSNHSRASIAIEDAISFEQALAIAQSVYPQGYLQEAELKQGGRREGFALLWKIEFDRGQEVYIDAMTGSVLRR